MSEGKGAAFLSPGYIMTLKPGETLAPTPELAALAERPGEKEGVFIVQMTPATAREWLATGEGHPLTRALVSRVLADEDARVAAAASGGAAPMEV